MHVQLHKEMYFPSLILYVYLICCICSDALQFPAK